MKTVILGETGKGPHLNVLSLPLYDKVNKILKDILAETNTTKIGCRGNAWFDYAAITQYMNDRSLEVTMFSPAGWDTEERRFSSLGRSSYGRYMNDNHYHFSRYLSGHVNQTQSLTILDWLITNKKIDYRMKETPNECNRALTDTDTLVIVSFGTRGYQGSNCKPDQAGLSDYFLSTAWNRSKARNFYHINLWELMDGQTATGH